MKSIQEIEAGLELDSDEEILRAQLDTANARIAELERVQGVLVGALDKIDRMTEEAGCNIGGPLANTNTLAYHDVAQEMLLDADNYLRCISKVSGAALAAARKEQKEGRVRP